MIARSNVREIPEWLKPEEQYTARNDRDGFLTKSMLSAVSVLRALRSSKVSYGAAGAKYPVTLKLVVALALIILCSSARNMLVVYAVLAVSLVHICFLNSEGLKKTVGAAFFAALFSAVVLIPSVFMGSPRSMLTVSLKVFVSVSLIGILSSTTEPNRLTAGLATFRVPGIFIMTLDMTLKYIVILGDIALEMLTALKMRSVGKNRSKAGSLSGILGVTFLKSRKMADEMYDAMICRGYGEKDGAQKHEFRHK